MFALLVPARDEAEAVSTVIDACNATLAALPDPYRVIVIDDHSQDGTAEVAAARGATVIMNEQTGLASAFRTGIDYALRLGADYIGHVDADGQYDVTELPMLLSYADRTTLVVGDRISSRPPGMSDVRYVWNCHLSELVASMAGSTSVVDSQSGFRVFHSGLANEIRITSRTTYTQEQIIRAARAGYNIVQPPVSFARRQHGTSRLVKSAYDYLARVFADLGELAAELGISSEELTLPPESIRFVTRKEA
jgi:glycosyltransferase involved in cell wall biosynthesis